MSATASTARSWTSIATASRWTAATLARAALTGKVVGCHPTGSSILSQRDTRKVGRLDFEWALGDHLLRFGLDQENLTTDQSSFYPGPAGWHCRR